MCPPLLRQGGLEFHRFFAADNMPKYLEEVVLLTINKLHILIWSHNCYLIYKIIVYWCMKDDSVTWFFIHRYVIHITKLEVAHEHFFLACWMNPCNVNVNVIFSHKLTRCPSRSWVHTHISDPWPLTSWQAGHTSDPWAGPGPPLHAQRGHKCLV